jgi:hypothetical protein
MDQFHQTSLLNTSNHNSVLGLGKVPYVVGQIRHKLSKFCQSATWHLVIGLG